jgi:hypothetical protein
MVAACWSRSSESLRNHSHWREELSRLQQHSAMVRSALTAGFPLYDATPAWKRKLMQTETNDHESERASAIPTVARGLRQSPVHQADDIEDGPDRLVVSTVPPRV